LAAASEAGYNLPDQRGKEDEDAPKIWKQSVPSH